MSVIAEDARFHVKPSPCQPEWCWGRAHNANVEFFNDLGSPGGAAKLGVIDKDHPLIEALPPQEHDE